MRIILDTHTFLWFVEGSPELSTTARDLIEDPTTTSFVSIASVWEMAIKLSLGKLMLGLPLEDFIPRYLALNGFGLLNITFDHVVKVSTLPFHHRDPFDRMLVAQSLVDATTLVSRDSVMDNYAITRVW